ncbi:unnamed protein product [Camellia sinensis]
MLHYSFLCLWHLNKLVFHFNIKEKYISNKFLKRLHLRFYAFGTQTNLSILYLMLLVYAWISMLSCLSISLSALLTILKMILYIIFTGVFLEINIVSVLVSDLFRGDPWPKDRPKTLFEEWLAQQTPERIAKDISTSKKWMMDEFVAVGISKKLGIIGFCFGGGRVINALAQDGGACFGIGVSFYGTRIDPSVVANIEVPVLFIAGDNDPSCPVSASVYDFLNVNFDVDVDVLYFRKY